jgi:hypothetical protein
MSTGIKITGNRILIDFNLHWVPAALGLMSPAAAAAMCNITEAEFLAYAPTWRRNQRHAGNLLAQPNLAEIILLVFRLVNL